MSQEYAQQAVGGEILAGIGRRLRPVLPWLFTLAVFGLWFLSPQGPPLLAALHGDGDPVPVPVMLPFAAATALAAALRHRGLWLLWALAAVSWLAFSAWIGLAVAAFTAAETARHRSQLAVALATAAFSVAFPVWLGLTVDENKPLFALYPATILALLIVGVPALTGLWFAARRQAIDALRDRAARVESEQAARADQARAEERARIAREMHDVLAHRVSLMVLHAGALEVGATDERTAAAAALIRTTGREALAELRQVLGVLRSPAPVLDLSEDPRTRADDRLAPQPTLGELDLMLARSRAAGMVVTRHDDNAPGPVPATVDRTAYRVVQEALTNVAKHAPGAPTEVVVRRLPELLEVAVHNRAPLRPSTALPGSGLGLVGLRERVELLGGEFHARPRRDGGFSVLARIPLPAEEEVA